MTYRFQRVLPSFQAFTAARIRFFFGEIQKTACEKRFFSQWKEIKLKNFEKIKVVKMYVRGITILPREDSVMGKGLKKLIKGQCPLRDMATAWELTNEVGEIRNR